MDSVAAHLYGVLRGAHDGRTDTLSGRLHRPGKHTLTDFAAEGFSERRSQIVERLSFLAVNILAHAAGKDHRIVKLGSGERLRQPQAFEFRSRGLFLNQTENRLSHMRGEVIDGRGGRLAADLPIEASLARQCL